MGYFGRNGYYLSFSWHKSVNLARWFDLPAVKRVSDQKTMATMEKYSQQNGRTRRGGGHAQTSRTLGAWGRVASQELHEAR